MRHFPLLVFVLLSGLVCPGARAETHFFDLSKTANRDPADSLDGVIADNQELQEKNGFNNLPVGSGIFRGVPFQILDPTKNQGRSLVVLKSRHKPEFPEAVSIPANHLRATYLYFLHTCRWGGTAENVTVAEYDIVYDDGQVMVIPLRVGMEFTNFFGADDTASSFLAWWHKYKNAEMGVSLFPWKNPSPDKPIQSILFKSHNNMPLPVLFAITASDKELPISTVSPKPEKTFQTDTSKWISLAPPKSSAVSTALDMSFLLDAPAGKHGKVRAEGDKLVFEDGTPARFWGVSLTGFGLGMKPDPNADLAEHLALLGCNAVFLEGKLNENFLKAMKDKGIYVWVKNIQPGPGQANTVAPGLELMDDPAVINSDLVNRIRKTWDSNNNSLIPIQFRNVPMVMSPETSLPLQLSQNDIFGNPFGAQWGADWPNEFLGEIPMILSAYSAFEGWSASFGWNGDSTENTSMSPGENIFATPQILAQWPTAALAYLRGDLKEGKIFVLGKDGLDLQALAHRSGMNPEKGHYKTDLGGRLKAKVNEKTKSFVSDTGQITWQGNVGVVKVEAPRFQALIGFLSHRKFNNAYWAVETPNVFASISAISLNPKAINVSDHLLLTGVTRMENTGMTYNQTKTKLLSAGQGPVLVEPLAAKIVLYRFRADPQLKIRALDADGQPLKTRVSTKWVKNSLVFSWVPSAFYFEIYK